MNTLGSFWKVKAKKRGMGFILTIEKKYQKLRGNTPIFIAQKAKTPGNPAPEEHKNK
jgi:hypothetical protein